MSLAILFALLSTAQADAQPTRTVETTEKIGSIKVPDEIAPAVGPYITCRIMASGTPLIVEGKPVNYNLPGQTDCAKVRENAAREADKLLTQQGMSDKAKRQAFVDRVLADADSFAAALSTPQSVAVAPDSPLAPDAAPAAKRKP
ncbi:hypothetical protein EEB18_004900 [Sphingopyxis sp. OPL5]|uniref:hypothetical protein n=1 Tax=Sphingopyxis sp. OPL5 TaxID=2486273 RepID=UPI00164D2E9C|nr:hypothetical protein [Sphingopyxis sp. OPL5]QNO28295.1 hypothetical protein EEB18_004900 [Sphingopyxis sp. OPL5]